jgi:[ribosomal protein S5]-alanine N-acetyltransferase
VTAGRPDLVVRLLTEADAPALLDYRVRNREFFRRFEAARADEHLTLGALLEELRRGEDAAARGMGWACGMFEGDALVGRIALSNAVRNGFQNAYLGYSVDERSIGRGHATRAARWIVRFGFEAGLHRIQAAVIPGNAASRRVLEKTGFRYEGRELRYLHLDGSWRDHDIFAITVEDLEGAA